MKNLATAKFFTRYEMLLYFFSKKMAESLENAHEAVLVPSGKLPVEPVVIKGYDFNNGVNYPELLKSFYTTGFQATNVAKAIDEINRMVSAAFSQILEFKAKTGYLQI